MNTRQIIFSYAIATLAFLFAACASNKVDWDGRVGNYTYDQALVEFGPPDKMAMLSDQSKVAEWVHAEIRGWLLDSELELEHRGLTVHLAWVSAWGSCDLVVVAETPPRLRPGRSFEIWSK